MSSELKRQTARLNGAKSRGPITPQGKARSSANSRRHGLTASVHPKAESEEQFQLLLADFMDQFQPRTAVETRLVEVMAIARWRLRRLLAIETHLFEQEMVPSRNFEDRLALTFKKLSHTGNNLALLLRYEGSLNRLHDKAFRHLLQLQSTRPLGSFRIFTPEPPSPHLGACPPCAATDRHENHRAEPLPRSNQVGQVPDLPSVDVFENVDISLAEARRQTGPNKRPYPPLLMSSTRAETFGSS